MFLFQHCFITQSPKTFSFHHMVLAIKTQTKIKTHIQKWRIYVRFVARPSREQEILKDTWKLFTKMLRCSVRSALKSLTAKMQ